MAETPHSSTGTSGIADTHKSTRKTTKARRPAAPRKRRSSQAIADGATRDFAIEAARLLNDSHFTDVLVLDLRGRSDVTDYIIIASGTSDRQIRAVADDVEELGENLGLAAFGRDADNQANWVVLDFVDVVVHLFEPATRAHYDLEDGFWGDAPRIVWRRRPTKAR